MNDKQLSINKSSQHDIIGRRPAWFKLKNLLLSKLRVACHQTRFASARRHHCPRQDLVLHFAWLPAKNHPKQSQSRSCFFFRYTGSFSTNLPFQTQRIQYTIFRSKSESTQNCHTLLSVCVVFYSPPSIFGWHLMIPGVSRKFHPVLKAESCITSLFGTDTNHSSSCSHT